MKKSDLNKLNEIIGKMTDLEVAIAQHSHFSGVYGVATKAKQLEWFGSLSKITSELDTFYKEQAKIK